MLKAGKSARRAILPQIAHPALPFRCLSPRAVRKARNRLQHAGILANWFHEGAEYGNYAQPQPEAKSCKQTIWFLQYHSMSIFAQAKNLTLVSSDELENRQQQPELLHLVNGYRRYGHLSSNLDPLGIKKAELIEELSAGLYGLTEESKMYNVEGIIAPSSGLSRRADLSAIIEALQRTYCRNISYEFEHITSPAVRQWFAGYVESLDTADISLRRERFFEHMTKAELFEQFLQKKLPNVKRYGLEGSEAMTVVLDQLIFEGSCAGMTDAVVGLTHRGRMTLLATVFGYSEAEIVHKLRGGSEFPIGSLHTGDIMADLGKPVVLTYPESSTPVNVDIVRNGCHLNSSMPVAVGKSRTKDVNIAKTRRSDRYMVGDHVLAITVHGDASFEAQGIVAETLGMSGLAHFTNGGTIHIVLNNQVGYTTPVSHGRSTRYASDIAKFADIPIIHCEWRAPRDGIGTPGRCGQYTNEVARAARIAFAYRSKFRKDVVIDMWTFRTRGHNEMDEPTFTQPAIRFQPSLRKRLINDGVLTSDYASTFRKSYINTLSMAFAQSLNCNPTEAPKSPRWRMLSPLRSIPVEKPTGVDIGTLKEVGLQSVTPAKGCKVHPRIERFHIKPRVKRLNEDQPVDWATAEAMAFGTLLKEGYHVRLSGQDVGRGTFSQRHAMLVCQDTEQVSVPLNLLPGKDAGKIEVVNSNLCEEAALAFEYGVSVEDPFTLAIWEAQFGDFLQQRANLRLTGYVTAGETKWGQQNGLVGIVAAWLRWRRSRPQFLPARAPPCCCQTTLLTVNPGQAMP
ncbi:Thiamin diphosphate-binding protein [Linderina pennispora]|uniref:Thiamin diphosphate-binding protein n=1 Tax=Linderina pennispora TaxID=61395 RepID=A0A1Y1WHU4_9FUNG|nr:thiamine diphosphate-binding protein [Linderina pennispora]ORX72908.1 Thiamin diphosphate-binding protein [Linderina pennispora]